MYELRWCEFEAMYLGWHDDEVDKWRHTRLILSAIIGKDARFIIELPGDFDHLKKMKPINKDEIRANIGHLIDGKR